MNVAPRMLLFVAFSERIRARTNSEANMENKGLCNTCINDKDCSFPRKFPVYLCEEFDIDSLKLEKTKIIEETKSKKKSEKMTKNK